MKQTRCEYCGKISYKWRERAMFAAVFLAARYGRRYDPYPHGTPVGITVWHLRDRAKGNRSSKRRSKARKKAKRSCS